MNEDTDDMYDDLFKKYGKVVFQSNDRKPTSAEIDDDAESLSCKLPLFYLPSEIHAFAVRKTS